MIEVKAIKYYSQTSHSDPLKAQEHVERLKEQHPDRNYTILVNTRRYSSYNLYQVVQIKHVTVRVPEPGKDFQWPPEPKRADYADMLKFQADQADWAAGIKRHQGDYRAALTGKLNP